MSEKENAWRIQEAKRRIEFLESLIAQGDLSPERIRDYRNEIEGLKNSIK